MNWRKQKIKNYYFSSARLSLQYLSYLPPFVIDNYGYYLSKQIKFMPSNSVSTTLKLKYFFIFFSQHSQHTRTTIERIETNRIFKTSEQTWKFIRFFFGTTSKREFNYARATIRSGFHITCAFF